MNSTKNGKIYRLTIFDNIDFCLFCYSSMRINRRDLNFHLTLKMIITTRFVNIFVVQV